MAESVTKDDMIRQCELTRRRLAQRDLSNPADPLAKLFRELGIEHVQPTGMPRKRVGYYLTRAQEGVDEFDRLLGGKSAEPTKVNEDPAEAKGTGIAETIAELKDQGPRRSTLDLRMDVRGDKPDYLNKISDAKMGVSAMQTALTQKQLGTAQPHSGIDDALAYLEAVQTHLNEMSKLMHAWKAHPKNRREPGDDSGMKI